MDRRLQGKINHNNGGRFEQRIDYACRLYQNKGIAEINKANEPIKPISGKMPGGWFKAVFTKKSGADYSGVAWGGIPIYFEAKFTSSDRITFNRVEPQQLDQLERAEAMGAMCYVLVCFSAGNVYRIPLHVWACMKDFFGRLYIKEDEIEEYKIAEPWEDVYFLSGIIEGGGLNE